MSFNLADIQEQLNEANISKSNETGVSFSGKSLKLNSEEDAKQVCDAIKKCRSLDYFDLEGNTLGPEAAEAIAKVLSSHGSNLKKALWKDMFTGRMKTEIPRALESLGMGLSTAGARLVQLDLSDNAFGPIGIQGLATLLSSSTCYTLQKLCLNNNGLGITGGKMLAKALLDCHTNSSKEGKPLGLKVFIAGRNRLEDDGATALAAVFEKLETLEEVVMPQNGIYHVGIAALASGLSTNSGLKILNLNDNTVGPKGAQALAEVLSNFPDLESLNLGDCLLKTKGAMLIAEALAIRGNHPSLIELNLTFNEIRTKAVDHLARAMTDKTQLMSLQLDGNAFGESGRTTLKEILINCDRIESLGTLDEDATCDEASDSEETDTADEDDNHDDDNENDLDDGDEENYNDNDEDDGEQKEEDENKVMKKQHNIVNGVRNIPKPKNQIDVTEFIKYPTGENLLLVAGNKIEKFIEYAKNRSCENEKSYSFQYIDELLPVIMKVSSLCGSGYCDVRVEAERLTDLLYLQLFSFASTNDQMSYINNNILVNLGLIKGENKKAGKVDWNLEGCFKALENVCQRDYFPALTKTVLKVFIERSFPTKKKVIDPFYEAKKSLKSVLDKNF